MSVTIIEIGRTLTTDEPVSGGESYQVIAAAQLPVAYMMAKSQFRQIEQYQRSTDLDARRVSIDSVLRTSQARLKQSLDRRDLLEDRIHKNTPLILDFPRAYLEFMKRKAHPEWYTACFMRNYTNSSVWAHYGDHHRGVCLIFDVPVDDNGQSYLALTNSRHLVAFLSHSRTLAMESRLRILISSNLSHQVDRSALGRYVVQGC